MPKLRASAALLVMSSQASATRTAYASDWRDFSAWCREAGRDPLPASADTLQLYVVSQLDRKAVSTIERRIAAVCDKHRSRSLEPPYSYAVKELMRGARRAKGVAPRQKEALSPVDLRKMCRELQGKKTSAAVRDRCILTLGFAGAMRRSEIVGLDLGDVRFAPKGVVVTIRHSKTDQQSKGREVGIFAGSHVSSCPVRALKAWLYVRGKAAGPLFPSSHKDTQSGRLSARWVGQIVKDGCEAIGLDPAAYGAHSLRAGCCTAAALDGVPESLIMRRSGHRSLATVTKYVRPATLFEFDILRRAM